MNAVNNMFTLLADQFATVPADLPADLRATLLRTLGHLPGVTVTQGARSTDGRPSVSLSWQLDNRLVRYELLLDPANARTIEYRTIATATAKGFQAGQTISSAVRTEGVVHALGQLP